jgi:hypothetical protein
MPFSMCNQFSVGVSQFSGRDTQIGIAEGVPKVSVCVVLKRIAECRIEPAHGKLRRSCTKLVKKITYWEGVKTDPVPKLHDPADNLRKGDMETNNKTTRRKRWRKVGGALKTNVNKMQWHLPKQPEEAHEWERAKEKFYKLVLNRYRNAWSDVATSTKNRDIKYVMERRMGENARGSRNSVVIKGPWMLKQFRRVLEQERLVGSGTTSARGTKRDSNRNE